MKKTKKLPKRVFVKWEDDNGRSDPPYLVAETTTESMEHGDAVGVYELVETRTKRVTHELK